MRILESHRAARWSMLAAVALPSAGATHGRGTGGIVSPPSSLIQPNPNTARAGLLHGDTLRVALEARLSEWRADGANHPAMKVEAFSEPGQAPLTPGPLVRAVQGTIIRFAVRNALATPLTFFLPASIRGGPDRMNAMDSIVVAPGAVGEVATAGAVPGNYIYRAITTAPIARERGMAGLLTGAIVIDASANPHPNDRVLVLQETPDSAFKANFAPNRPPPLDTLGRLLYTINGLSWPHTERVRATVGDSLHWRVINASHAPHPMHLHGFYFRVDTLTGPLVALAGQGAPRRHVVTELMLPLSSMSMTWSPDRPGNWLFHCHFAVHLEPDSMSAAPDDPMHHDMVGLVLGVLVAPRGATHEIAAQQAGSATVTSTRQLRLIAVENGLSGDEQRDRHAVPSMRFVIEENGRRTEAPLGRSPELDLVRGQPVAITIVNRLDEPTSVHWHGIEVEDSYSDGVAGFSGGGDHLAPDIAPGDSFTARFTPPRAGSFMYHAHMDEVRQQRGGMVGALIVRDPGVAPSPDEHVFFLNGSRRGDGASPLQINGTTNSDTVVIRVGRPARLRLMSLAWTNPTPMVSITTKPESASAPPRNAPPLTWTLIAKDGFDLPAAERTPHPARQVISMGETYDFLFTPPAAGDFVLAVRSNPPPGFPVPPQLFASVVIRAQ